MSSIEWLKKLENIVDESDEVKNNPTAKSVLYMLNNMVEEYGKYKELGSIEELEEYKRIALNEND